MILVEMSLLAYLKLWIVGCSFLMMLLMVWWCLRLSWIISPRSLAEVVCSIGLPLTLRWIGRGLRG